jgi:azurin
MVQLEKRDKGIMCFVIFLFAAQFIAISYVSTSVTGWSSLAELDYNVTDHYDGADYYASFTAYNATGYESQAQTLTHNNVTKDTIVASIDLTETADTVIKVAMGFRMNSTFLAASDVTRVVISYNYVGYGNMTSVTLNRLTPSPTKAFYTTPTGTNPVNNGSITWDAEAFEAAQLKLVTKIALDFVFDDASNVPVDADYIEVALHFYTSTLLLTQEQILQGLAGSIGLMWFVLGAAVSPFWNPGSTSGRRS